MIKVSVDLHNPGQYFACCGLLEVANQLWPGSTGWFAGEELHLEPGRHVDDPIGEVRRALCGQDAKLAPDAAAYDVGIRPLVLPQLNDFRLDWWLHWHQMKTWAGNQTPQATSRRCALRGSMVRPVSANVFTTTCVTTGQFGFDPASAWDEIDLGFSQ